MSANAGLRLVCADILDGLAFYGPPVDDDLSKDMAIRTRRYIGAGMLRWAERFEYGDPVPTDEHQAALDELKEEHESAIEGAVDDVRTEVHAEYDAEIDELKEEIKRLQLCIDEAREHLSRHG